MSFLHCIIGIVEHMNPLSMRSYAWSRTWYGFG